MQSFCFFSGPCADEKFCLPSACSRSKWDRYAILSKDSLVATNAHVLSDINLKRPKPQDIHLECNGKKFRTKEILYLNHQEDLALLRLKDKSQHYISLSENRPPKIGDTISIIGFPSDSAGGFHRRALTKGVINNVYNSDQLDLFKNKKIEKIEKIETDATIGPGSSGSPVLLNGLLAGIVFAGEKERKDDLHGKSFAVSSKVVKRAIDYTRWSSKNAKNLPSIKACLRKKTRDCSKRTEYLWNRGDADQALSMLESQCRKGVNSDCSFAKKMSAIIKDVKVSRKKTLVQSNSDKNKFFEYAPPTLEEEEKSLSPFEKLQRLSPEEKITLTVILLIILALCLRIIFFFFGDNRVIRQFKKEGDKTTNRYLRYGTRLEYLSQAELKQGTPLRGIINKVRHQLENLQRTLESLKEKFQKEMIVREESDSRARYKFDNMYIKIKRPGYKMFGLALLLLEGLSVLIFLSINLRKEYNEVEAYFYSLLMALFVVSIVHLIKKIQYRFWHHTFKLYLIALIPSVSVLAWRIVEGRTGGGVENLLEDPLFTLATMLTAIFGALSIHFYPGSPQQQDEYTCLIENRDEQKEYSNHIKSYESLLSDLEQDDRSVSGLLIEGAQCFISRLKNPRNKREAYIKEIEKRIQSETPLPNDPPPHPSAESSTIKIMPRNHSDNYDEYIH